MPNQRRNLSLQLCSNQFECYGLLPVAVIGLLVPRYFRKNTIEIERKLIFEESAVQTLERLGLSD